MLKSRSGRPAPGGITTGVVAFLAAFAVLTAATAPAQAAPGDVTASFVTDPDPLTGGSDPANMAELAGDLYFAATTEATGRELFRTDGTEAGTELVKEINPGENGSAPRQMTVVGGSLFFVAGSGIWKTDGTEAGTTLVKSVSNANTVRHLTNLNGTLLFVDGDDPEIWRSDGTPAGTTKVTTNASSVNSMVAFGGYAYFSDNLGGSAGDELYRTDGTAAGTTLVKDINPGTPSSSPRNFRPVGGTLFFQANGELWKSDGTAAGTVEVKDIRPTGNSMPENLTNVGGTLYFTADDGTAGVELWKSDGTAAGTVRVKDIWPGATGSATRNLTVSNGVLFFTAASSNGDYELWRSDGTAAGTIEVADIAPGFTPTGGPANLTDVGGVLFFTAAATEQNQELWKSDGTAPGTVEVKDINPGIDNDTPSSLTSYDGQLIFAATDGPASYSGTELWRSDGSSAGTAVLANVNKGAGTGSGAMPVYLTDVDGTLFFRGNDRIHGEEPWISDGTSGGTGMIRDVVPGPNGNFDNPIAFEGDLLFRINGSDLWRTDGTETGTTLLKEGGAGSNPVEAGGIVYYNGIDPDHGIEPWRTDGTAAGTGLLKDINPGSSWGWPSSYRAMGDIVFFTPQSEPANGAEIWRSDGTEAGTELVKDIRVGSAGSSPNLFGTIGDRIIFSADDGSGRKLWISDGTAAGTEPVSGAYPSSGWWATSGDELYFGYDDGTHGMELWKSDGTAAGTQLVADINPSGGLNPARIVEFGDGVAFVAGLNGDSQLWLSDGTEEGTRHVGEINPGGYDDIGQLTEANGVLLFWADGGDGTGRELWKSDGTAAGTAIVRDIYPGPTGSLPLNVTSVGDDAYFTASDPDHAWGLWKAEIQGPAPLKPEITATDPTGPSSDQAPLVRGSAPGSAVSVEVFTQAGCQGTATTGTTAEFEGAGIEVDVDPDATTQLSARTSNSDGAPSPCSEPFGYEHDGTPPPTPEITAADPAPPSSDPTPSVSGTVAGDATAVEVFTQSGCQGTATTGSRAGFEGAGIEVTVGANATTQLSARARDAAGNWSPCSSSIPYTHDDVAPAAPSITGTAPGSPSSDPAPAVQGTADSTATRVRVFTQSACNGSPVEDTKAAFEGAGIGVTVSTNQTTPLSARARDAAGNWSTCATGPDYTHDDTPPATPAITGTDPASPSDDAAPRVNGTSAADATTIEVFTQAGCAGTPATGSKALFEGAGITVSVTANTTTQLSVRARDAAGNSSGCSTPTPYVHDDVPPSAPEVTSTDPPSPSSDPTPRVLGSATASAVEIAVFTEADCQGARVEGSRADFVGAGIEVVASANATSEISALAIDAAGNESDCSGSIDYRHDDVAPAAPTITGSSPSSPANDNAPRIRGTAEAGSSVRLFPAAQCGSTTAIGTTTAADFAGTGIQVSVPDNTTTAFAVIATDQAGNASACSAPFAYEERTPPPPDPPAGDTTPPQTSIDAGPKRKVKSKKASFTFSSDEPGAQFECKLDAAPYKPCQSPATFKAKRGKHLLSVRATDAAGNVDTTPATWKWQVKKKRKRK